jgi:uncharacterized protein YaaN involved in tellurite resistance
VPDNDSNASAIVLRPPDPVPVVSTDRAAQAVPLAPDDAKKLDEQVTTFIGQLTSLDFHGQDFKARVDAISTMGNAEMASAAAMSNRMLDRPANTMRNGLFDSGSSVSKSLVDLRETVERLDPSRQGDLFAPRRLLGVIPFGTRLEAYFDGYRSSQAHLNAIIETLYRSKDELEKDDVAVEAEKAQMWALMQKLEQYIYLGKRLDAELSARLDELDRTDPDRAKVLREDVLFYVRQKVTDLLTQMAVNVQGYLALDLIKKNNIELIKGVDRATVTTVSALRTAVIVAQALANEKLVLDQVSALNTTTGNVIESTSAMLKQQTAQVYEQASSATIDIQKLQAAFDNIYATMDAVADYKVKALANMQQTVDALSTEVARAKTYLDRTRSETARSALTATPSTSDPSALAQILPGGQ